MEFINLRTSEITSQQSNELDVIKQGDTYALFIKQNSDFKIIVDTNSKINIIVNEVVNTNILIEIEDIEIFNYALTLEEYSIMHIVVFNNGKNMLIEECHKIKHGASAFVGFGELNRGDTKHIAEYNILGKDTKLEARYAFIADNTDQKVNDLKIKHHIGESYANLEFYGVVKKRASLIADVSGYIMKGASGAITHQASRVLTFDETVNAKISPILYIDENDVKASHACSLGTLDENQLYYLQSRGLSLSEATNLVVSGYLSVLANIFEKEELVSLVNDMILKKAGA